MAHSDDHLGEIIGRGKVKMAMATDNLAMVLRKSSE